MVKCTLVQALRPCTGRTAHRGRGIALLFHDHGTRRGWGVSVTPRPLFTPGKNLVPIVQEAGWAPGPVWISAENLAPTGIRSWTAQPVTSRYTDYATWPTVVQVHEYYIIPGQLELCNLCVHPCPPTRLANQCRLTCHLLFSLTNQVRLPCF
jgi:hypothetical protein